VRRLDGGGRLLAARRGVSKPRDDRDLEATMNRGGGRTFRVFVSSTFSDLRAERNALARIVFPRLRALCEPRGYKFQAVDLRWGVRDEAALDHQTVRICLEEIARCQRLSPRPNFIVLLGDRYGWCPLPSAVPADEMDRLRPHLGAEDLWRTERWYRRDDNAVPAEYVLQPRQGDFEPYEAWEPIERELRTALAAAAGRAGLEQAARARYRASATEQEIVRGALDVPEAEQHVFAFFRSIRNLDDVAAALPDEAARALVDTLPNRTWDRDAWAAQQRLRDALADRLGTANVWPYEATWMNGALNLSQVEADLCEAVWQRLSKVIAAEMDSLDRTNRDPLEVEKQAHADFAAERRQVFVGRAEPLRRIADYVSNGRARPLVVHGPSGSGKSALMARAVADARAAHPGAVIVERYIGASPGASEIRALLESLCQEIARGFGADETPIGDYPKLVAELPTRLARAAPDRPAIVFLDALDQLGDTDDGRRLVWLPRELPPAVRIVVSTLEEPKHECFGVLRAGADEADLIRVTGLGGDEGRPILDTWLASAGEGRRRAPRTLTSTQRDVLLAKFAAAECSPLYLKLAFEEARRWHSYDGDPPAEALPVDVLGIIRALFARLSESSQHGPLIVSRALGYLAAVRYGLNDEELLDLLWRNPDVRKDFDAQKRHDVPDEHRALPPVIWSRLYFDLERYLNEREIFGVRLISFFHRQLADVAETAFLAPQRTGTHGQLADFFAERWPRPDTHALLELVGQLARADRAGPSKEILLKYEWLDKKLAATNIHLLLGDYNELRLDPQEPAGLVAGALRLSSHVLGPDPDELANQLIGRLGDDHESRLRALAREAGETAPRPALLPLWPRLPEPGGDLLRVIDTPASAVSAVRITAASSLIAASHDGALHVWDLPTGRYLRSLKGHASLVDSVAVADAGRVQAISGSWDNTVKIWDLATGSLLRSLVGHTELVLSVAVSAEAGVIVSGSWDGTIRIWDLATGSLLRSLVAHTSSITSVAVSASAGVVVSGSGDTTVKVWDLATGVLQRTLEGHTGPVRSVAMSAGAGVIASGSEDKTIKIWDLATGNLLRSLAGHVEPVSSVDVCTEAAVVVSGSHDRTVKVWDLTSGRTLRTLSGHTEPVTTVAVSAPAGVIVSGSWEGRLRVWSLASGRILRAVDTHRDAVTSVTLSAEAAVVVSGSNDNTVRFWDLASGRVLRTLEGHAGPVLSVAMSAEARIIVSGSGDKTLKVWDLVTGRIVCTLEGHTDRVLSVAVDPSTSMAVSGSGVRDKSLKVWDLATGRLVQSLEGHTSSITSVAVSAGKVISGSKDATLMIWDLATGRVLRAVREGSVVSSVAVSTDARVGVTGSWNSTVKVWDLATGHLLRTLEGHRHMVLAVAVSTAARVIVSGSYDKTVRVWDLATGRQLGRATCEATVNAVSISRDGRLVAAGDTSGRVYLFEIAR
jgi:WD40 repeat protein